MVSENRPLKEILEESKIYAERVPPSYTGTAMIKVKAVLGSQPSEEELEGHIRNVLHNVAAAGFYGKLRENRSDLRSWAIGAGSEADRRRVHLFNRYRGELSPLISKEALNQIAFNCARKFEGELRAGENWHFILRHHFPPYLRRAYGLAKAASDRINRPAP